jgi:hypothetical protein
MFPYFWSWNDAAEALNKVPREVVAVTGAYLLITDLHKRHTRMKVRIAEENAKVRLSELEVEKLRIQHDMAAGIHRG